MNPSDRDSAVPLAPGMTHKAACRRMAAYLKNSVGCTVVVAELSTLNTETPDVIGFKTGGHSIMVEVKVSRADFLADKGKSFRRQMDRGMGDLRYFAAPKGLLKPEEIPEAWGLLEIEDRCVRMRKEPVHQPANKKAEVVVLMSALRRLEISTAVYVRAEEWNVDASPPPEFRQEFMGSFTAPRSPAKVGDIARNHHTGHISRVVSVEERADKRMYAQLESGFDCILPSNCWEYGESFDAPREACTSCGNLLEEPGVTGCCCACIRGKC